MLKKFLQRFGLFVEKDGVSVFWYYGTYEKGRNFGDALSPYLIEKISHRKVLRCNMFCLKTYYLTIGSILYASGKNAIIWGSGIISRDQNIKKPKNILAVRGPLTRMRMLELGYDCPEVYGDPALLLPRYYKASMTKKYELGIIPHYVDFNLVKEKFNNEDKKTLIINIFDPIEKVIDDINSCKKIVSSSLHGVITPHAYGVPSLWVKFSNSLSGDGIKFADYFLSVGLDSSYVPPDFTHKIPSRDTLCSLFDKNFSKPNINVEKLLEVCPFKY